MLYALCILSWFCLLPDLIYEKSIPLQWKYAIVYGMEMNFSDKLPKSASPVETDTSIILWDVTAQYIDYTFVLL